MIGLPSLYGHDREPADMCQVIYGDVQESCLATAGLRRMRGTRLGLPGCDVIVCWGQCSTGCDRTGKPQPGEILPAMITPRAGARSA